MAARKIGNRLRRRDRRQLEHEILEAFSAKAKRHGLRSVIMGELASELRMSATTLYALYPSKEALALACVERWAKELAATEAAAAGEGLDGFMRWVEAWADAHSSLSPAFRRELESDFPAAWRRYRAVIQQLKGQGAALLQPALKSELDPRVAFAILNVILEQVVDPEFAGRLRVPRRDAIRSALTIWAAGALDRRAKLRAIGGEG